MAGFEPAWACSQNRWATAARHADEMVDSFGFEPKSDWVQASRFPVKLRTPWDYGRAADGGTPKACKKILEARVRLERTTRCLRDSRSTS